MFKTKIQLTLLLVGLLILGATMGVSKAASLTMEEIYLPLMGWFILGGQLGLHFWGWFILAG
ncbi:hypothetical protein KFU94_33745 [Chloroflexi bacterium TSY]|nr:hypothetical protein [Chloroflexi bacterium TSY]